MHELRRKTRFSPPPATLTDGPANGFGGVPDFSGLSIYDELEVSLRANPDPVTGYVVDIKEIDRAVRSAAAPVIWAARANVPCSQPGEHLPAVLGALNAILAGRVNAVTWRLTPYYSVAMESNRPTHVLVRQRFDFAAAHRLHTPTLSDEENRRLFGRCNSPSGHGHNYQVEPCVEVPLDPRGRQPFTLAQLESITGQVIVDPFDHKHLNIDTREFGPGGVNPTVENIAKVFFDLLAPAIRSTCPDAALRSLTVWETDRTCCTYSPS